MMNDDLAKYRVLMARERENRWIETKHTETEKGKEAQEPAEAAQEAAGAATISSPYDYSIILHQAHCNYN